MKILTASAGLLFKRIGGVPAYVEELIAELQQRGHQLVYLDFNGDLGGSRARLIREDSSHKFPCYTVVNSGALMPWSWEVSPRRQVRASRRLKRLLAKFIDREQPDIIHFHELIGVPTDLLPWLKQRGQTVVFTSQDFYPVCPTIKLLRHDGINCTLPTSRLICKECCAHKPNRWELRANTASRRFVRMTGGRWLWMQKLMDKWLGYPGKWYRRYILTPNNYQTRRVDLARHLQSVDAVVCMSKLHEAVTRDIVGPKIALRQMYLSRKSLKQVPVAAAPGRRNVGNERVFIALNIVEPAKGPGLLYQAFHTLELEGLNFQLKIYGARGEDSERIQFIARYDESELDTIVAEADFGVVPSIWREAYSYVGVEMLSRGLPILVSSWGAMTEYVQHGINGLIFNPEHPANLSDVARELITDPGLCQRLWQHATQMLPFESFAGHVDKMEDLYAELRTTNPTPQRNS